MSGGVLPTPGAYRADVSHVRSGPTPERLVTCGHCDGYIAFEPDVSSVALVMAIAAFGRRHALCPPDPSARVVPAGPVSGFLGEMLERKAGDVVVCAFDHTTREASISAVFECRACKKERYVCEFHEHQLRNVKRVLCITRGCAQAGKAMRLVEAPPDLRAALGQAARGERNPRDRTPKP